MVMKHFIDCQTFEPQIKFPRSNRSAIYRVFVMKSPLFTLPSGDEERRHGEKQEADIVIVVGQSKVQAGAYYESPFIVGRVQRRVQSLDFWTVSVFAWFFWGLSAIWPVTHAFRFPLRISTVITQFECEPNANLSFCFFFAQKFAFLKKET